MAKSRAALLTLALLATACLASARPAASSDRGPVAAGAGTGAASLLGRRLLQDPTQVLVQIQVEPGSLTVARGKKPSWVQNPRRRAYPEQAKRGICWQFRSPERGYGPMTSFSRVAWSYNWGVQPDAATKDYFAREGVEFVPMQWSKWSIEKLPYSIPPHSRYLLGFNEPNHAIQANLSPQEAASLWPQLEKVAADNNLKLVSPGVGPCTGSVCNPGYEDPFKWMDEFLQLCANCKIDVIAVHYYACNLGWLKGYLNEARNRYGRPVWLTEFSCPGKSRTRANRFAKSFMQWADTQPWLERYAWFTLSVDGSWIGGGSSLIKLEDMSLTKVGRSYNAFKAKGLSGQSMARSAHSMARSAQGGQHSMPSMEHGAELSTQSVDMDSPPSWGEVCGRCSSMSESTSAEEREYCREDCGFWDRPSPAAATFQAQAGGSA